MARSDLRRRLDNLVLKLVCPQCGFRLGGDRATSPPQHTLDDYQRFLADASDEQMVQLATALDDITKAIQVRHTDECRKRGETPVILHRT